MPQRFDARLIWAVPLRPFAMPSHIYPMPCRCLADLINAVPVLVISMPLRIPSLPCQRSALLCHCPAILRFGLPCPCPAVLCHDMPAPCVWSPCHTLASLSSPMPLPCKATLRFAFAVPSLLVHTSPLRCSSVSAMPRRTVPVPRLAILCPCHGQRFHAPATLCTAMPLPRWSMPRFAVAGQCCAMPSPCNSLRCHAAA